jgi:sugar transport system substrate-binding protein
MDWNDDEVFVGRESPFAKRKNAAGLNIDLCLRRRDRNPALQKWVHNPHHEIVGERPCRCLFNDRPTPKTAATGSPPYKYGAYCRNMSLTTLAVTIGCHWEGASPDAISPYARRNVYEPTWRLLRSEASLAMTPLPSAGQPLSSRLCLKSPARRSLCEKTRQGGAHGARKLAAHIILVVLLSLSLLLSACAPKDSASQPLIAAILPGQADPGQLEAGMRAAVQQGGASLWVAKTPTTVEQEAARVEQALQRHPAALVISPLSPFGSQAALKKAAAAGVKVVCLGTCVEDASLAGAFLPGPDRDMGALSGAAAAELASKLPGGKAQVGVLPCPGSACALRQSEFLSRLRQSNTVEIVQAPLRADQAAVEALLKDHPDLNFVWAADGAATTAALKALEALHLTGKVDLFGQGLDENTAALVGSKSNTPRALYATAVALPYQAGYDAAKAALALAQGGALPANLRKSALLVTPEDWNLAQEYLKSQGKLFLPTLSASLPSTGSGIKPSCGCRLTEEAPTPTPP